LHDLLHSEVCTAHDAGAEEEALNVVPLVEIESEGDDFLGGETGAPDIAGASVDTVVAVVEADVGQKDLQEGNTATVRSVGVADARSASGADASSGRRILPLRAGAGAGSIIFGGVSEDLKFLRSVYVNKVF